MSPEDLFKRKEEGPYFHLSLDDTLISDLMHPHLGYYKFPTFGYYGPGYPMGDLLCVVRANANALELPYEITSLLADLPYDVSYQVKATRKRAVTKTISVPQPTQTLFYFVISDITDLIDRKGTTLNLVDHAWVFPDWGGKKITKMVPKCVIPIEGVSEAEEDSVGFANLKAEYLCVHKRGKDLCISPDNQRLEIAPESGVAKCWTVAVDAEEGCAVVSLQWLVCHREHKVDISHCTTLRDLMDTVSVVRDIFTRNKLS